jgi:hypothetical protein
MKRTGIRRKRETENNKLAILGIDRHSGEGDTDVTINRSTNPNATCTKRMTLVGSSLSSRVVARDSRRSESILQHHPLILSIVKG